jgi:hypothetical protein
MDAIDQKSSIQVLNAQIWPLKLTVLRKPSLTMGNIPLDLYRLFRA